MASFFLDKAGPCVLAFSPPGQIMVIIIGNLIVKFLRYFSVLRIPASSPPVAFLSLPNNLANPVHAEVGGCRTDAVTAEAFGYMMVHIAAARQNSIEPLYLSMNSPIPFLPGTPVTIKCIPFLLYQKQHCTVLSRLLAF